MNKKDTRDYSSLSKEELIEKIRKLDCHVKQLRNVITKRDQECSSPAVPGSTRKRTKLDKKNEGEENGEKSPQTKEGKKVPRPYDFSSITTRHVALKFLYMGWDYQGLAAQEDTGGTIEAYFFNALTLTKLIEDRTKSNYNRCGRTDKGVSAFCQVISIDVRSKIVDGEETLDYCKLLNRALPKEIRVIAWSPVRPDFSARFDCCQRTYKYYFPKADLDIEKMVAAAQPMVGTHDFRNFCKIDKSSLTNMRRIISIDIVVPGKSPYDICQLVIVGQSFLWHQIRCIIGILVLIGQGLEEIGVIEELLDIEKNPKKPQYSMAIDYPLVLYDVQYPDVEGIKWIYTSENMTVLLGDIQSVWMPHSIKSAMVQDMANVLEKSTENKPTVYTDSLLMGSKRKMYLKLMDRDVCGGDD